MLMPGIVVRPVSNASKTPLTYLPAKLPKVALV